MARAQPSAQSIHGEKENDAKLHHHLDPKKVVVFIFGPQVGPWNHACLWSLKFLAQNAVMEISVSLKDCVFRNIKTAVACWAGMIPELNPNQKFPGTPQMFFHLNLQLIQELHTAVLSAS